MFWVTKSPSSHPPLAEWDHDKMERAIEIVHCADHPGHQGGGNRLVDLNVILHDVEMADFIWTWYSECLVQESALAMLRSYGFTGFEVKPVNARFSTSLRRPPNLWELVVTGWAGMARHESGIRPDKSNSCITCGQLTYTGLQKPDELIQMSSWDESDFFMVWPMPKYIFVTRRVCEAIRSHKLTGIQVIPSAELEKTSGFTPGRLHYYMPADRAHQLGDPLGIY
jgi:hypothetical protein